MHSYDAIVVGARCAGAATAMLLAREGLDVLLVDRATFPSEIPHGHLIHRHGPRLLAEWGLLDDLVATGCPPITTETTDYGDFPLTGTDMTVDGIPAAIGPRRAVLDELLVRAAADAGAEVREGFAVHELTRDGDRVTGLRGREVGRGAVVTERAALVIGADGRNSSVARAVQAPALISEPTVSCWYFSYWSGAPSRGLEVHAREGQAILAFPTGDDLLAVFVAWPIGRLPLVRADVETEFLAALEIAPDLAARVRFARREERFYGAAQLPNVVRVPHGPGWALVGDAGCHKDPFMALGMSDALRDAALLAETVAAERPLSEYQERRDEATLADFHENLAVARLGPPPPAVLAARAAARDDPEEARRFLMAREGMTAPVASTV